MEEKDYAKAETENLKKQVAQRDSFIAQLQKQQTQNRANNENKSQVIGQSAQQWEPESHHPTNKFKD